MSVSLRGGIASTAPEAHGYTDLAIGHFSSGADFDAEVARIICGFWSRNGGGDPDLAWQDLWSEGYVTAEIAYRWRAEVWCITGSLIQ